MGTRQSHPAIVTFEEAEHGLGSATLQKVNELWAIFKVRATTLLASSRSFRRRVLGDSRD